MIGDRSYGIFNLRIQNASLDDDAEFQCQVGPATGSLPIRTSANLTVICEYSYEFGFLRVNSMTTQMIGLWDLEGSCLWLRVRRFAMNLL
jgi:hypothetical protein